MTKKVMPIPVNLPTGPGAPWTAREIEAYTKDLIAELVAVLRECANRLRYDGDLHDNHGNETRRDASWEAMRMAEAAIAKAESLVPSKGQKS